MVRGRTRRAVTDTRGERCLDDLLAERADRGRHAGTHPRPHSGRAGEELPLLWEESGTKAAVGETTAIADGGYQGTGLVIPHRRRKGEELPRWKEEHNRLHKQVRSRVEHTFARMKGWKILRDCRLNGDGVHHAMLGIARLYNLTLSGWASGAQ